MLNDCMRQESRSNRRSGYTIIQIDASLKYGEIIFSYLYIWKEMRMPQKLGHTIQVTETQKE